LLLALLFSSLLVGRTENYQLLGLDSEKNLLGTADLVVVGVAGERSVVANVPEWMAGQMTIRVEKVLKGIVNGPLVVRYPKWLDDSLVKKLLPEQRQLFFLQRGQGGAGLVEGTDGIRGVDEVEKFSRLLEQYPVAVTLSAIPAVFRFGDVQQVTMRVTNTGKDPVQVLFTTLEGYYFGMRLDKRMSFRIDQSAGTDKGLVRANIDPGAEYSTTIAVSCNVPDAWQVFTPETYLQTVAAIRGVVLVNVLPRKADNTKADSIFAPRFYVGSKWVRTIAGFSPPPDDDGK